MKVLHIDSSARFANSSSRMLSSFFLQQLKKTNLPINLDRLDLALTPPRHVSEMQTKAMHTPSQERTPDMVNALNESESLCDRVLSADMILCAMPMYNFGMPSTFKAFIDNIVRVGKTFAPSENGFSGFLSDKKIIIITTRGANFKPGAPMATKDCLTPHLTAIFGFLGAPNPIFINAHPLQFEGEEAKTSALETAKHQLIDLAVHLGSPNEDQHPPYEPLNI